MTAGNNITLDSDTFVNSANGVIDITAGNDLSLISTGHIESTTGNICLTATSGNIVIGPYADGVLSISGNIDLSAGNNVDLGILDTGGDVTLTLLAGVVTDNNGVALNVTADDLTVTAPGGVDLDTSINTLTVDTSVSNGDVTIREADALALNLVDAGTGNVTISLADGAITDNNGDSNNINATDVVLSAVTGIGSGDALEMTVDRLAALVTTGNGNIEIVNTGDLVLDDMAGWGCAVQNVGAGKIDIVVNSNLTVDDPVISNGNDITSNGGNITINATSLTQNDDSAINAQTGGNVDVITTGDISLDSISGADVTLTSNAGAISETGLGDAELDITATNLTLFALNGIGSGNAFETDVDNLQATNTNNGIEIANAGGMTIMGTGVSNTNGWVALTATGGADGDINIKADITAGGVSGTTGNGIRILADDDVLQNANITSNNTIGAVYVEAGVGTTDGIITVANGTSTISQNDNGSVSSIEYKADGDISLSYLSSTGTVKVTSAAGAIIDNNLDSNNINGNTAILTAANGIGYGGATANALETSISNLSATNSTSGDIRIDNSGNLNIITPGVINSASGGVIFIDVASNLNVNPNVTSNNGDIALTATGSIIQSTGTLIGSGGGNITLWADTDDNGFGGITQNGTASIASGGGNILLNAGVATGGGNILLTRLDAGTGSVYVITYDGSIIDNDSVIDDVDILAGADSGLYAGGGVIGWEYNPITGIWTRDPIDVDIKPGHLYVYASDVAGPYPISVDIRGLAEIDVSDNWGTPPGLILYNDSIVGGGNIEDVYRATTPDLNIKTHEISQYLQWLLETIVDEELGEALDKDDGVKMKKRKWWRYITR